MDGDIAEHAFHRHRDVVEGDLQLGRSHFEVGAVDGVPIVGELAVGADAGEVDRNEDV